MRLISVLFVIILTCGLWTSVQSVDAQGPNAPPSDLPSPAATKTSNAENTASSNAIEVYRRGTYLSAPEFYLSLMVTILGIAALAMEFWLLKTRSIRPEDGLPIFGITLIVFGALLTTTAGYSAADIAPTLGLLGTVAGFLFGRGFSRNEVKKDEPQS